MIYRTLTQGERTCLHDRYLLLDQTQNVIPNIPVNERASSATLAIVEVQLHEQLTSFTFMRLLALVCAPCLSSCKDSEYCSTEYIDRTNHESPSETMGISNKLFFTLSSYQLSPSASLFVRIVRCSAYL